ncbi:hypothetical protein LguiB_000047 [Lonicera macranthoides]
MNIHLSPCQGASQICCQKNPSLSIQQTEIQPNYLPFASWCDFLSSSSLFQLHCSIHLFHHVSLTALKKQRGDLVPTYKVLLLQTHQLPDTNANRRPQSMHPTQPHQAQEASP